MKRFLAAVWKWITAVPAPAIPWEWTMAESLQRYTAEERRKMYSRPRWQKLRLAILARDNWRCQHCKRVAKRPEVHHIHSPFYGGPMWDPANLQVLCRDCHFIVHAPERRRRALAKMDPERRRWRELINNGA